MRLMYTAILTSALLGGFAIEASAHTTTIPQPTATPTTATPAPTPNTADGRPLASYDLNDPKDVKAFWEQLSRNHN